MQKFIEFVWTINALLTVRSEMLPFSGNNQNIKMFGGPPPEHFATGYVLHNYNLPLANIALQYCKSGIFCAFRGKMVGRENKTAQILCQNVCLRVQACCPRN